MVSVKKKNFSCILYSTYIHVSNLQSAARNQFEIDLQGNIFFTPFQYISSTLSNLVHTGLHTQQSTFRSLAEGLFSAATPRVILVNIMIGRRRIIPFPVRCTCCELAEIFHHRRVTFTYVTRPDRARANKGTRTRYTCQTPKPTDDPPAVRSVQIRHDRPLQFVPARAAELS